MYGAYDGCINISEPCLYRDCKLTEFLDVGSSLTLWMLMMEFVVALPIVGCTTHLQDDMTIKVIHIITTEQT